MEAQEKWCGTCQSMLTPTDFNKNRTKPDGLNTICRTCSQARSRRYYAENTEKHKAVVREQKAKQTAHLRKIVRDYFSEHPCVDCGYCESPAAMQFDHLRDKQYNISSMVCQGVSEGKLLAEIDKCVARCANCHAIKTAKDYGWHSLTFEGV